MGDINPAFVSELEAVLQSAASGVGDHKNALDRIAQFKQSGPDFFRYCAYMLANPQVAESTRQLAAFQLKNSIRNQFCNSVIEVRQFTLEAVCDESKRVRAAACGIIATAISQSMWDPRGTVNELISRLNTTGTPAAVMGCLSALSEIVEENIELLDFNGQGSPASTPAIGQAVLTYLGHDDASVQLSALTTVTVLLEQAAMRREGATYDFLGGQLQNLLLYVGNILSNPASSSKYLCLASQCMYFTLAYGDHVAQHVGAMTNLMVNLAMHKDEAVRIEVVQFFKVVVDSQMLVHVDQSVIPNVLRYILDCLVYGEMELGMLQESENNAHIQDRPEDVRPKNFQLKARRAGDDDEMDDDDDEVDQWNLRKAAGGCLLNYVNHLGDAVLEHILNDVAARLNDSNYLVQESAILAIGIMSGGCQGLRQYLTSILDRLLGLLEGAQAHFLVKGMCLWTLEQNAEFIMTDEGAMQSNLLPRSMQAILAHMMANTKIIQARGCTALDSFAGASDENELEPYVVQILQTMSQCFEHYKLKNLYLLFETADTVYQCFGRRLAEDDAINLMMQPLMQIWSNVPNDSPLIFPFFMAMSAACSALGAAIEPMAQGIFERSFGMVEYHVGQRLAAIQANDDMPEYSQEFLVAGLDLLSGLCEALGSSIELFVKQVGEDKMCALITTTATDTSPEVRQSSFSVLGELCSGCIGFIQLNWGVIAPLLANALEDTVNYTVASNAAWSLSDYLANYSDMAGGQSIQQTQIDGYYARLANLLTIEYDSDMRIMRENAAIGIARLIALDPSVTQRVSVPPFQFGFCAAMAPMKYGPNMDAALRGMLPLWKANPGDLAPAAAGFLDLLGGLPQNIPQDLRNELKSLVGVLKNGLGAQKWNAYMGNIVATVRNRMQRFGV